jgi:hypothetical protein
VHGKHIALSYYNFAYCINVLFFGVSSTSVARCITFKIHTFAISYQQSAVDMEVTKNTHVKLHVPCKKITYPGALQSAGALPQLHHASFRPRRSLVRHRQSNSACLLLPYVIVHL